LKTTVFFRKFGSLRGGHLPFSRSDMSLQTIIAER